MANALRLKTGGHYLIYWTRSRSRDELNYSRSLAGPPDHAARADNASRAIRDISIYGLRVRTELDPGDWPDAPGGDPDVVVRVEPPAPATFEGARYTARFSYRVNEVEFEIRGVGRYIVAGGAEIRVAPDADARPEDVRLYLTGASIGMILHQRGVYPLHAGCVAIDGTGVAFAGSSGNGKSTTVAALVQRGATFISDDICALTGADSGTPHVWCGAARLKLDDRGMAELHEASGALESAGGNRGKYHVPVERAPLPHSVPLSRVYILGFGEGEPRLEPLARLDAISALVDETYLLPYAVQMGLSPQIFKSVAALSTSVTVCRLTRPRGFEQLDAVCEMIERDVLAPAWHGEKKET